MPDARHDLGPVETIKAEAIGEPGQRTFRLLVDGPKGAACLWLEKEQLSQLSMAIRQLMALSSPEDTQEETAPPPSGALDPGQPSLDFKVGKLSLGHEPRRDLFLVEAHDREDDQDEDALVRLWASRAQMKDLVEEAEAVVAAGRPLCPLCSAPMGPEAHICPRSNGHNSFRLS